MKKLAIVLIALLLFVSLPIFAQSADGVLSIGLIGTFGTIPFNSGLTTAQTFDYMLQNAVYGMTVRLKISPIIGFNADFLYKGKDFYIGLDSPYGPNGTSYDYYGGQYWFGPVSKGDFENIWYAQNYVLSPSDQWSYYVDKLSVNVDIGLYIPIWIFQPYLQVGPSFNLETPNAAVYGDGSGFKPYYDAYHEKDYSLVGFNFKIGMDIFLGSGLSIGLEMAYMVANPTDFFVNIQSGGFAYLITQGQVGATILLWL